MKKALADKGFNRNIVECKAEDRFLILFLRVKDLIETSWNVKRVAFGT